VQRYKCYIFAHTQKQNKMKRIITAIVILFTTALFAQTNDTITKLDDVFISGIRSNKSTPVTTKIAYRSEIQKTSQSTEITSYLTKTPNITMSSDNGTAFGYTYFRLRGIDQTKINMTLNGAPLNDPEDQGVFFSNYPNFLDNIQSVEIQRGVGTSTNGVSSFAGSINFNTPSGIDKGGDVKLTIGSFNTSKLTVSYSTGLNKKMSLYTNVSTYKTDGYRYMSGGNGASIFLSGGYFGEVNKVKFTAFTGHSGNEMAWLAVAESDIKVDPKTNYNSNDATDSFNQSFVQVEYNSILTEKLNLNTSVFYNRLDGSYDYAMNGSRNLSLSSNFYGALSNLSFKSENDRLDFGLSANSYTRYHKYDTTDYFNATNNNHGIKNELSSYIKYNHSFDRLVVSVDLQVRHSDFDYYGDINFDKVNWNFFNPKVGMIYNVNAVTNTYFSIGKSHREPTRTNMFGGNDYLGYVIDDSGNVTDVVNFNNVNPESVINYELGLNHRYNKLYLQANLFYMNFKNEIALIGGTTPSGVSLTESVDKSFRSGLELDLKYNVTNNFNVSYNYSFTYAKVVNGDETFYNILTPKNISNLTLSYTKNNFLIELVSRSQSKSYLDLGNTATIGAFNVINTNIGYTIKSYSVLLSLYNLTSEKYYTNGSLSNDERQLFTNPKINGFITFKYIL
jgi:iron complex outermembrane receptor protein